MLASMFGDGDGDDGGSADHGVASGGSALPAGTAEPPKAPADPLANDVLMQMFLNDPAFASLCAGAALPAADSP